MRKVFLIFASVCLTLNMLAQDAVVSGVKVNQPAADFESSIVTKKFTKTKDNHFKGTFAGYPDSEIVINKTSDGWINMVSVNIPTDGTYKNSKDIAESLILAYNKKYGSEYNKFKQKPWGNFDHQLCTDEICFNISISDDNSKVHISYVIQKRDTGINSSDI